MASEFNFLTDAGRQTVVIEGESVNAIWDAFIAQHGLAHVLYVRDLTPQIPLVVLG